MLTNIDYLYIRNRKGHMTDLEAFGIEVKSSQYFEEAFYRLLLVYTVLFDKIAKYLDGYELTPAKMNVLMIIKHQGKNEGLSQREISTRLMVSPSNMTRLLDKLERDKLIERVGQEGDKRVKIIRISSKGSKLLDTVWPGYMQSMKQAMDKLTLAEQKVLSELLFKWLRDLRR